MASPTVWFKFSPAWVPSLCGWAVRGGGLPTEYGPCDLHKLCRLHAVRCSSAVFKSHFPTCGGWGEQRENQPWTPTPLPQLPGGSALRQSGLSFSIQTVGIVRAAPASQRCEGCMRPVCSSAWPRNVHARDGGHLLFMLMPVMTMAVTFLPFKQEAQSACLSIPGGFHLLLSCLC